MEAYIDIHSHILPGLDDGSENLEMSVKMLRLAMQNGIRAIILTPHYKPMRRNPSAETVEKTVEALKDRMREEKIDIRLYVGNEIYYSSEVLLSLQVGEIFTMANSSYLLVEFNPAEDYGYIRDGLYRLMSEGYYPIIAHVERYINLMKKKSRIKELADMGSLIQVNASSITGDSGRQMKKDVKWLLEQGYVHFAATDSHDDRKRTPEMRRAAEYVSKKYGEAYSRQIFYENAEKILRNDYL